MTRGCTDEGFEGVGSIWLPTASGGIVHLLDPRAEDVDFADVATGLASAARFSGQIPGGPYTVAQHSAEGADAIHAEALARGETPARARDLAAGFTLHDAHESVVGDKTPILMAALSALCGADVGAAMAELKARLDRAVYARAGRSALLDDPEVARAVHEMDLAMCLRERDDLAAPCGRPWRAAIEGARRLGLPPIRPVGWREARAMWLDRFERYVT